MNLSVFPLKKGKIRGEKSSESRQVKSKISTKLYQVSELMVHTYYGTSSCPFIRGRQTFVLIDISFLDEVNNLISSGEKGGYSGKNQFFREKT